MKKEPILNVRERAAASVRDATARGAVPSTGAPGEDAKSVRAAVGHERLVGVMCPSSASGRSGFAALTQRLPQSWSADPVKLRRALAVGRTVELAVLSFDGARAGWFTPVGVTAQASQGAVSIGGYAGAAPCAAEATASECMAVLGGCGVAVGSPEGDDPTPRRSGACVAGSALIVDVDGDGRFESFSLAALRNFADELTGTTAPAGTVCTPRPALAVGRDFDIMAVADLDGDGRVELIASKRGATSRQVAVYSAEATLRLARVGTGEVKN
jgi:hypothetical protein